MYFICYRYPSGAIGVYSTTKGDPVDAIKAVKADMIDSLNKAKSVWCKEEYVARFGHTIEQNYPFDKLFVCTYELYNKLDRKFWLTGEIVQISGCRYLSALEELPPLKWGINNKVDSFFCSEMFKGNLTSQYACHDNYHFTKLVDISDRTTWFDENELNTLIKGIKETRDAQ